MRYVSSNAFDYEDSFRGWLRTRYLAMSSVSISHGTGKVDTLAKQTDACLPLVNLRMSDEGYQQWPLPLRVRPDRAGARQRSTRAKEADVD